MNFMFKLVICLILYQFPLEPQTSDCGESTTIIIGGVEGGIILILAIIIIVLLLVIFKILLHQKKSSPAMTRTDNTIPESECV